MKVLTGSSYWKNIPSFQKPRFISMVENLTGQKRFPQMKFSIEDFFSKYD